MLALYGLSILGAEDPWSIVEGVNLFVHEAGHLIFSPFGEFMTAAGGTIMQLLMPLAFWFHFRRRDPYASTVMLWWIAQNGWGIAHYAGDARAQVLPLLNDGEHDWSYMLERLKLLQEDQTVSRTIWLISVLLFMYAIFAGVRTALLDAKKEAAAT